MKNISFGLYRLCQKSDIKETKKGIYVYFCTGASNAKVMLGRTKQLFRNVASFLPLMFFTYFDGTEVRPSGSTRLLLDIHPRHLDRVKERVMPGWP